MSNMLTVEERGGGEEEQLPEDVCGDEELLVVQVFLQLRQVVHVRQLLPELMAEKQKRENLRKTNKRLTLNLFFFMFEQLIFNQNSS